ICLGCIIKGETQHDEFIAHAITDGIMQLNLRFDKPVILGVLTVNSMQQAEERAGGKLGNKGTESILAAIKMLSLQRSLNTAVQSKKT
ncbi:MAG: 6,7-dimethyl-8-ribityllumazine synthase, partial [Saprospiraceae bacterium]